MILKKRRKVYLPEFLTSWHSHVSSGEHLNYECARIKYHSKLMNNVFNALSLNSRKVKFITQRKFYLLVLKIFKNWRNYSKLKFGLNNFVKKMRLKYLRNTLTAF